jgi:hypothetical protein
MPLAVNACNALSGIDDFTIRTGADTGIDGPYQGEFEGSSGGVGDSPWDGGMVEGDALAHGDHDGTNDAGTASRDAGADAASDTGGGETGSCDGGSLVAHSNGLGQTFYDCAPPNTLNQTQAFAACAAFSQDAGACMYDPGFSCMGDVVCSIGSSVCACWVYDGNRPGRVCSSTTAGCCCPGASAPVGWN